MRDTVLVHLAAGIGNIVLATPLLVALGRLGFDVDLWLSGDYAETADLFRNWAVVRRIVNGPIDRYVAYVPAIPPFYWHAFGRRPIDCYTVTRPPDELFWRDEQAYYLAFARALGYDGPAPDIFLPVPPGAGADIGAHTVVLAPGCKTGEMAAKRWPFFPELSSRFDDVAVVGTTNDLRRFDGTAMRFPPHVRVLAGRVRLRTTVELMAQAAAVVANDSGLGHVAAALGVPTVLLFGPTPDRSLGRLPSNVTILRAGLPCEPCWFAGERFRACNGRIDCLREIAVDRAEAAVTAVLPRRPEPRDVQHVEVWDGPDA